MRLERRVVEGRPDPGGPWQRLGAVAGAGGGAPGSWQPGNDMTWFDKGFQSVILEAVQRIAEPK